MARIGDGVNTPAGLVPAIDTQTQTTPTQKVQTGEVAKPLAADVRAQIQPDIFQAPQQGILPGGCYPQPQPLPLPFPLPEPHPLPLPQPFPFPQPQPLPLPQPFPFPQP